MLHLVEMIDGDDTPETIHIYVQPYDAQYPRFLAQAIPRAKEEASPSRTSFATASTGIDRDRTACNPGAVQINAGRPRPMRSG